MSFGRHGIQQDGIGLQEEEEQEGQRTISAVMSFLRLVAAAPEPERHGPLYLVRELLNCLSKPGWRSGSNGQGMDVASGGAVDGVIASLVPIYIGLLSIMSSLHQPTQPYQFDRIDYNLMWNMSQDHGNKLQDLAVGAISTSLDRISSINDGGDLNGSRHIARVRRAHLLLDLIERMVLFMPLRDNDEPMASRFVWRLLEVCNIARH